MGGRQQLGDYMIKISGRLFAAAAMTLLAPSAFADGVMLEANGARAQDRWGGELGLGYALDAGGFSIRPIGGVFVHAGDDDRYERDTFRNGQSRCRDTETGQFASDSKCTNLDVKWYAKLEATYTIPLGPEIGQCCGGRTVLRFTKVTQAVADGLQTRLKRAKEDQPAVFIFGAGHVGKALAQALSLLPLSVSVVETRRHELDGMPGTVATHLTPMPESMVASIPMGGAAIIVTHDHALDFMIAGQALARTDLSYIGMIGSKTKRATFANWLARDGATTTPDRLVLPIGGTLVKDKRPAVIASLVAAEVLCAIYQSQTAKTVSNQEYVI